MKSIDDKTLMKFIDGELNEVEVAKLEELVQSNELLAKRIQKLSRLNEKITEVFADIDEQPLPAEVLQLLDEETENVSKIRDYQRKTLNHWYVPTAIAASLVLFISSYGLMYHKDEKTSDFDISVAMLNTMPTGTNEEGVNILASYISTSGEFCRHYSTRGASQMKEALACRDASGNWQLLVEQRVLPSTAYIPAGESESNNVQQFLSEMRQLTKKEEQKLLVVQ